MVNASSRSLVRSNSGRRLWRTGRPASREVNTPQGGHEHSAPIATAGIPTERGLDIFPRLSAPLKIRGRQPSNALSNLGQARLHPILTVYAKEGYNEKMVRSFPAQIPVNACKPVTKLVCLPKSYCVASRRLRRMVP